MVFLDADLQDPPFAFAGNVRICGAGIRHGGNQESHKERRPPLRSFLPGFLPADEENFKDGDYGRARITGL